MGRIAKLPGAYLSLKQRTQWGTLANDVQLVGLAEAAAIVGVAPSTLAMRRASSLTEGFPKPIAELRCGPIWRRADIEAYARRAPARRPLEVEIT